MRCFWLVKVFTCTGRYRPTRIICAMPRASLRSVLLRWADSAAFMCRVSTQTTGRPASAKAPYSHCENAPASSPMRSIASVSSFSRRLSRDLHLAEYFAHFINDADAGFFHGHVKSDIQFHGCASSNAPGRVNADLVSHQSEAQPPKTCLTGGGKAPIPHLGTHQHQS